MKKIILVFIASGFLTACAAIEPIQFKGPSGRDAYSMKCSGLGRTIEACYKKAGEICPNGYVIIDKTSSITGVDGDIYTKQGIAIECK
jgi:hypothetical protein